MSVEKVIENMQELVKIHELLNEQANEKTTHLVNGNMKGLEASMKSEEALTAKLEELERSRSRIVNGYLSEKGILAEDVTMSELLKFVNTEEKLQLLQLQKKLLEEITTLKRQNSLNQDLIKQSLQYVNLSLNLLNPKENAANYRHPERKQAKSAERQGRSLFDSKA